MFLIDVKTLSRNDNRLGIVVESSDEILEELPSGVPTYAWVLPRPRNRNRISGSFPLYFEEKLFRLLGYPSCIIQPFSGYAEYGLRIDLRKEVKPHIIADSHNIPLIGGLADCIVIDPPYSNKYSKELFNTPKLKLSKCIEESKRILCKGGFLVIYHIFPIPAPKGFKYHARILLETRINHRIRWIGIFKKEN